ncbi:MAG TPA: magnesium chelatase ATPase subunit I [Ktedonobacter sp.]|nr:magnesium chelatase ATPase subunit I [Ktedonobacter sp.]
MLTYPFSAIVGQEEMKLALILNAIQPAIGGVLIRGERGTAKSTAVRALAAVLPEITVVSDCPFSCPPNSPTLQCASCRSCIAQGEILPTMQRRTRVVDLPINASEDRVVGTLDLEHALREGQRRFEPGVLAEANRGILYVDEVNLLDDYIVDVLLDSAAMGTNIVEREGVSFSHPARFLLVGTMNPEEGELRPQLTDRFGLCVDITSIHNLRQRVAIVEQRERFESSPEAFLEEYADKEQELRERILRAALLERSVTVPQEVAELIATINIELDIDGHRGDIVLRRAAQSYAAYLGLEEVTAEHVYILAPLALSHRLKHHPMQQPARTIQETLKGLRRTQKNA